jgi:uncharacterized protein
MDWLTEARWSPYVVGAGIGILGCIAFVVSDKFLGCSGAFSRACGMIERAFRGPAINDHPYYCRVEPVVEWEVMMVAGVVIGAFLSAMISGDFKVASVPPAWSVAFGGSIALRLGVAALGGVLMGFGARWAGGCTSGHGISGTLQLALSSWIAAACFFAGGIAAAMLLYRLIGA